MSKMTNDIARQKAQEIWNRNTRAELDARRIAQQAAATKTARLRELRLTKAAADRERIEHERAGRLGAQRRRYQAKPTRLRIVAPE